MLNINSYMWVLCSWVLPHFIWLIALFVDAVLRVELHAVSICMVMRLHAGQPCCPPSRRRAAPCVPRLPQGRRRPLAQRLQPAAAAGGGAPRRRRPRARATEHAGRAGGGALLSSALVPCRPPASWRPLPLPSLAPRPCAEHTQLALLCPSPLPFPPSPRSSWACLAPGTWDSFKWGCPGPCGWGRAGR